MDFSNLFQKLFEGNNAILLLLALFLFKDQLFSFFKPKPADPTTPLPGPGPVIVPVTPEDRPLLDLIVKGRFEGHSLESGDFVLFASVGAGMHINAFLYRMP